MAHGFRIHNLDGFIQIDGDYECARLIASGQCLGPDPSWWGNPRLALFLPNIFEARGLIILVRPHQFGKWFGSLEIAASNATFGPGGFPDRNGHAPGLFVYMEAQTTFDYAIFHLQGSHLVVPNAQGLEVYKPDGTVVYSSRYSYPTLETVAQVHPFWFSVNSSNYPVTIPLSDYTAMPWILANPLLLTYNGVGEETESIGYMCATVNSLSSFSVGLRFSDFRGKFLPDTANNSGMKQFDPYDPSYYTGTFSWTHIPFTVGASKLYG